VCAGDFNENLQCFASFDHNRNAARLAIFSTYSDQTENDRKNSCGTTSNTVFTKFDDRIHDYLETAKNVK
jgi:hypothetical protein